jgi:hypothetical protein
MLHRQKMALALQDRRLSFFLLNRCSGTVFALAVRLGYHRGLGR